MPARQMITFFTSNEGYGWTEKLYWAGSLDPNVMIPLLNTFVQQRAAFLTSDSLIVRIRIASGHKRDPLVFDYLNVPAAAGQYGQLENNSDNAVLVRLESTGIGYNRLFMRGIPDTLVTGNIFTPDSAWVSAFNTWKNNVQNSGNFSVVAGVDNPQPKYQVDTLSMGNPKGIVMVMKTGFPGFIVGTKQVRISGAAFVGYNGLKNIVMGPVAPDTLTFILGGAKPNANEPASNSIFATAYAPNEGPINFMFWEKFSTRKPGRFFGQRPGRARTQLSQRP